jgi:flagellar hook-associated protein 3 FlgL
MRITNQLMTDKAIRYMNTNLETMNKLQDQVNSQKKYQTISDNPYAASMGMSLKSRLATIEDYANAAEMSNDWLNANEFAFQKMESLASRADTLLNRASTDSLSDEERQKSIQPELESILKQAVDIANSKYNGQYIFAGYKTNGESADPSDPAAPINPPFILNEGTLPTDNYTLSTIPSYDTTHSEIIQRNLEPGKSVTLNFFGDQAFSGFMNALVTARNTLNAADLTTDPPGQIDKDALRNAWSALQSSMDKISQYHTENGARMRQVDSTIDFLDKSKSETETLLTKNDSINLADGISQLTNQKALYQIVLEVSQRAISTMNLFDYLQQ